MAGFLTVSFIYIACWSIMFYSQVYRWTFINWVFFACITVASFVVLVLTSTFGVLCWLNFGKGLAQYREQRWPISQLHANTNSYCYSQSMLKRRSRRRTSRQRSSAKRRRRRPIYQTLSAMIRSVALGRSRRNSTGSTTRMIHPSSSSAFKMNTTAIRDETWLRPTHNAFLAHHCCCTYT